MNTVAGDVHPNRTDQKLVDFDCTFVESCGFHTADDTQTYRARYLERH